MPYDKSNMPDAVKKLSPHDQEIWLAAFNAAWKDHPGDEGACMQIAWSAIQGNESSMKASMSIMAAVGDKQAEDYGYKWYVRICKFGEDENGTIWNRDALVAAIPVFNKARLFQLSEAQHAAPHPYGKPTTEIVGWISDSEVKPDGLYGFANLLRSSKKLRDDLVDSFTRGVPDLFGLSNDVKGKWKTSKQNGKIINDVQAITSATIDVVYDPAAGGNFLRMAAARQAADQKEATMKKKLLAAIKQQRPDLKASIEALEAKGDAITEDEVLNLQAASLAAPNAGATGATAGDQVVRVMEQLLASIDQRAQTQVKDLIASTTKTFDDRERLLACSTTLISGLQESGLVDVSRARVRSQFEGKIFEPSQLTAAIKAEKDYVDTLTGSGAIDGMGGIRASVTGGHVENAHALLTDFFKGKNNQHSIRAAYAAITGDIRVTGRIQDAPRLKASISTTTFDQIFADVAQKQMIEDYVALGLSDWRKIVKIVPLSDFKTVHRIRKGGYGNLPVVAQGADYLALATPTDEEQSYVPTKKGGTEDLTIEAIKNDDAGGVRDIPKDMAMSAAVTLYEFVFNDLFATNPDMGYDSTALFHADHGNLGATALDAASLTARRHAMQKQARLYNGKRLNIVPKYGLVPVDLDKTLFDLIAKPGDFTPTSADFTRTFMMEPIVVVCWTDANNWGLVADPRFCPTIEIGFVDGNEDPQIFVQDLPNVGSMFNADKITLKIKHPYGGVNLDHRGVDYSVPT